MSLFFAQNNYTAGDLEGNFCLIERSFISAVDSGSDLVVFSELAICGYPVDDLLQKDYFIAQVNHFLQKIIDLTKGYNCAVLIGLPILQGEKLFNGAVLIVDGQIKQSFLKNTLPNYKLFDEKRYFSCSNNVGYFEIANKKYSVLICEDVWNVENIDKVKSNKSDAIIVINASPFSPDKNIQRCDVCMKFALGLKIPLIYVNQVGSIDSFVFDGGSFVMNQKGEVVKQLSFFTEDFSQIEIDDIGAMQKVDLKIDSLSDLYCGATLALRDYIFKTGFKKVVIGMSGGIDSALVATIAVDAIGPENVRLIALPTKYNSNQSFNDANICSKNLDIELQNLSIQNIFDSVLLGLEGQFKGYKRDVTEQNIQSRIRGMLLMAVSNKFGELLITTGNKSEMATGYATIYGDMNGAFNPIKDLYKTQVFNLAKWRNENIPHISVFHKKNIIPRSIIEKEPSAELDFDQKDSDSLPNYEILDRILFKLIEEQKSALQIIKETGCDSDLVEKIVKLFYQNEYKRKQAAPGPKLSKMSFDRDRRYLITNKFWY